MEHVDPKTLKDDRWGYSVYTCVIMAPEETQRRVQTVRDEVRVVRSMIPAHVTARGGVGRITDLQEMLSAIRSVCEKHPPFEATLGRVEHWGTTSVLECELSKPFKDFHHALVKALEPISTSAYSLTGDNFRSHLTIFSDPAEDLEWSRKVAEELVVESRVPVTDLHVWGHSGVAYTGRWDQIKAFRLASTLTRS